MVIGACTLELHLPACRNLKDKRAVIKRVQSRLAGKFNVAVAEVGYQDLWQRSCIGVVSVSSSRPVIESLFAKLVDDMEGSVEAVLTRVETEYL